MKERMLALFLVLVLCLSLAPTVLAAEPARNPKDAETMELNDTLVFIPAETHKFYYYKFEAPYTSFFNLTFSAKNNDLPYHAVFCRIYSGLENVIQPYVSRYWYYDNHALSGTDLASLTLTPGKTYYLQLYADTSSVFYLKNTFTCAHINTTETLASEATCAEEGVTEIYCNDCNELVETKKTAKLDHTWSDWETTQEPTCGEAGIRTRTCEVCGQEDTASIPKGGEHSYGDWIVTKQPTATKTGTETQTCSVCGKQKTRSVPAIGIIDPELSGDPESSKQPDPIEIQEPTKDNEITVTKVNSSMPTVIVLVVPTFADVSSDSWYQSAVTYAYSLGLMVGISDTSFNPMGNLSLAEAITMAVRVRNNYDGGSNSDFSSSGEWYRPYVDYAIQKNIISEDDFSDYTRTATRAEMAYIFARALPSEGLAPINTVTSLPDVAMTDPYGSEIYQLYRAGVLTGTDSSGTFHPNSSITRSETAAIITRMILTSERKNLALQ